MRGLGIRRKQGIPEPEDHLGALCEMMAGMINGAFGQPMPLQVQKEFFNAHMAPWAAHCLAISKRQKVLCSMLQLAP